MFKSDSVLGFGIWGFFRCPVASEEDVRTIEKKTVDWYFHLIRNAKQTNDRKEEQLLPAAADAATAAAAATLLQILSVLHND